MASLDGVELFDSSSPTSGGAFLLNGVPKASLSRGTTGGWTIEVKEGGRYVVAWNQTTLAGYQAARQEAFTAVQQALDMFSIARSADLGVRDAETEHITWWPEGAGQVLRVTHMMPISLELNIEATIKDAAGNIVPPAAKPPANWHESLRYFRLAQVTDDLFDAYRNAYLALESILDRIAPQRVNSTGKTESESKWLKRALGIANSRVPLARFCSKGSTNPVKDLFDVLYVRTRTALFHAKGSRPSLLPHASGAGQDDVRAAVMQLTQLFIALAETELGTRSIGGGLFPYGFDLATKGLISNLQLHASADEAAANPEGFDVINSAGSGIINLKTQHAPELEKPFVRSFLGTATAGDVRELHRLAVVAATLDGQLAASATVDGELILSGVERLEAQLSIRQKNARQPKEFFAT